MGESTTKRDGIHSSFKPTKKQQAILEVLLHPYHRMATVTRQCELAGISRKTFYEYMHDPDFMEWYQTESMIAVRQIRGQLINIGIREARKGGQAGSTYWKELMKIGGLIEDDKVGKFKGQFEGEMTVRFVGVDEPEDDNEDE